MKLYDHSIAQNRDNTFYGVIGDRKKPGIQTEN